MVNVSKNDLLPEVKSHMYDQLAELFLANTQKRAFAKTLFEILTPAERIMLAKRVGIIGMLTYGHSVREISTTFKVSTSTIFLLSEQMSAKNFTHVVEILKRKKYRQSFLGILETIVTVGGIAPNPQKKLREKVRRDIEAFRAGG